MAEQVHGFRNHVILAHMLRDRALHALLALSRAYFGRCYRVRFGMDLQGRIHAHVRPRALRVRRKLELRPHTLDAGVFSEIFLQELYDLSSLPWWPALHQAALTSPCPLVLDLGANVGFASLALHWQFPQARILAVEPEAANFAQLCRNVSGISAIVPLRAAVAPRPGQALIVNPQGNSTGFRTALADDASHDSVPAYTVEQLWDLAAADHPESTRLLVKMDVEGAEKDLFGPNGSWLRQTPLLFIEPHDGENPGESITHGLMAALAERKGEVIARGSCLLCWSAAALERAAAR